jgi:hypothetical protein
MNGQCEQLLVQYGEDFGDCNFDKPNGASVLAIDGGTVALAGTVELGNDLLPPTAPGAEQWLDWSGFLQLADGAVALLGSRSEVCSTVAACDALGAVAYPAGGGSPGSCGTEECGDDPAPLPDVHGSLRQSVLVPLTLASDGAPELGAPAWGGAPNEIYEVYGYDAGHALLRPSAGDASVLAYTVREPIYGPDGNGLADSHGQQLSRHHVQFIDVDGGVPSFGDKVNVPGTAVLLEGPSFRHAGRGQAVFTLEPAYRSDDSPTMELVRLRVEDGVAHVEERVDVGPYASAAPAGVGRLAVLSLPADYCASDARYEFRIADLDGAGITLSEPLVLERGDGWGFGFTAYPPESAADGKVHLFGGPAANGRLIVDITTDPPSIAAYETR